MGVRAQIRLRFLHFKPYIGFLYFGKNENLIQNPEIMPSCVYVPDLPNLAEKICFKNQRKKKFYAVILYINHVRAQIRLRFLHFKPYIGFLYFGKNENLIQNPEIMPSCVYVPDLPNLAEKI